MCSLFAMLYDDAVHRELDQKTFAAPSLGHEALCIRVIASRKSKFAGSPSIAPYARTDTISAMNFAKKSTKAVVDLRFSIIYRAKRGLIYSTLTKDFVSVRVCVCMCQ